MMRPRNKSRVFTAERTNLARWTDGQVARGGGLDDHGEQGKASWMGKGRKRLAGNLNSPCTCLASLCLTLSHSTYRSSLGIPQRAAKRERVLDVLAGKLLYPSGRGSLLGARGRSHLIRPGRGKISLDMVMSRRNSAHDVSANTNLHSMGA